MLLKDNFDLDYKHPQLLPDGWLKHIKHHVCFDPDRVRGRASSRQAAGLLGSCRHEPASEASLPRPQPACSSCRAPAHSRAAVAPGAWQHPHGPAPWQRCSLRSTQQLACLGASTLTPPPASPAQHLAVPVFKPPQHYSMSPLLGAEPKKRDLLMFFRGDMGLHHGDGSTYSRNIRQTVRPWLQGRAAVRPQPPLCAACPTPRPHPPLALTTPWPSPTPGPHPPLLPPNLLQVYKHYKKWASSPALPRVPDPPPPPHTHRQTQKNKQMTHTTPAIPALKAAHSTLALRSPQQDAREPPDRAACLLGWAPPPASSRRPLAGPRPRHSQPTT
jgi:hypothetical protein